MRFIGINKMLIKHSINKCHAYRVLRPKFDYNKTVTALSQLTPAMNGNILTHDVSDPTAQLVLPFSLENAPRLLRKLNPESGAAVIYNTAIGLNEAESQFQKIASILEAGWESGDSFDDFTMLPPRVFAGWIGRLLTSRYRIDLTEQQGVKVACAIYWYIQSHSRFDVTNFIEYCSRASNLSKEVINHFLERDIETTIGTGFTVNTFLGYYVDRVEEANDRNQLPDLLTLLVGLLTAVSPRLRDIFSRNGIDVLVLTVSGTWQGANRTSITTAALEVRSVFLTMIYTAIRVKTVRVSTFSKLLESIVKETNSKDLLEIFAKRVELYLDDVANS